MRDALFPPMWSVIPARAIGGAVVEHITVSEAESRMTALHGGRGFVAPGKYCRLMINGCVVMSDTPYERRTNAEIVSRASGTVLIAGLGIGMILTAIMTKQDVGEVVVIEKEFDVIRAVEAPLRRWLARRRQYGRLRVVHGDIFSSEIRQRVARWAPYDALYFDIWGDVSTDALAEMSALTRKYRSLRRSRESFMACWDREWLRYRREQERRAGW